MIRPTNVETTATKTPTSMEVRIPQMTRGNWSRPRAEPVRARRTLDDVVEVDLEVAVRRDEAGEDSGAEDDHQAEQPHEREPVAEEAHARVRPLAAHLEVEAGRVGVVDSRHHRARSDVLAFEPLGGREERVVARGQRPLFRLDLSHNGC